MYLTTKYHFVYICVSRDRLLKFPWRHLVLINFIHLHAAATVKKIAIFTYPGLHFLFALGTPLWQSCKTLHEWKEFSACQTLRSMYPSIFNSLPVIRTASAKNRRFHVLQPTFLFGDAPAIITQYVSSMESKFNACQTPRSMYLFIFNNFRVIRCLSQCVSPKIVIFKYRSPDFCFPWRRPCDHAILHGWKDNSVLAKPFAVCAYLS